MQGGNGCGKMCVCGTVCVGEENVRNVMDGWQLNVMNEQMVCRVCA